MAIFAYTELTRGPKARGPCPDPQDLRDRPRLRDRAAEDEGRRCVGNLTERAEAAGEKRKAAEVVANAMRMLDRANRSGGDGGSYERPRAAAPANGGASGGYDDSLDEEEIPF